MQASRVWGGAGGPGKDAKGEDCVPKRGTLKTERKRSAPASALAMGFQLLWLILIKYRINTPPKKVVNIPSVETIVSLAVQMGYFKRRPLPKEINNILCLSSNFTEASQVAQ